MAEFTRKQFLRVMVTIGAAAASLGAIACGGDDDGTGGSGQGGGGQGGGGQGGGASCDAGASGTVGDPMHDTPHTLMDLTASDVTAGAESTFALEMGGGNNLHGHEITVTAADFAELQAGNPVLVTSTEHTGNNGMMHSHDVTLTCL